MVSNLLVSKSPSASVSSRKKTKGKGKQVNQGKKKVKTTFNFFLMHNYFFMSSSLEKSCFGISWLIV